MIAYEMIAIVDHLHQTTHALIEPIVNLQYLSDSLKADASQILILADILADRVADCPNLNDMHDGLADLRAQVERFMKNVGFESQK
jgi:hypothetical protein